MIPIIRNLNDLPIFLQIESMNHRQARRRLILSCQRVALFILYCAFFTSFGFVLGQLATTLFP